MAKPTTTRSLRKEDEEDKKEDEEDTKKDAPAGLSEQDEKTEDEEDRDVAKALGATNETLGRVINILKGMDGRMNLLEKASAYPQQFAGVESNPTGGVTADDNPEGKTSMGADKVKAFTSPEGRVKPQKDTDNTQGAFVGPDDAKMGKMLEDFRKQMLAEVAKATAETIKASTPAPMAYKDRIRKSNSDAIALFKEQVYAAVGDYEKRSTFSTDAENGEGGFLALSIPQQEDHYVFMRKLVDGSEVA